MDQDMPAAMLLIGAAILIAALSGSVIWLGFRMTQLFTSSEAMIRASVGASKNLQTSVDRIETLVKRLNTRSASDQRSTKDKSTFA